VKAALRVFNSLFVLKPVRWVAGYFEEQIELRIGLYLLAV
jgi:cytochrome c oxidase subunit IV